MQNTDTDFNELKNVNYELFLAAITILSVANIFLIFLAPTVAMRQVVWIVDLFFCIFFLGDFVYRLLTATSKRKYLTRQYGWLDLLGSLPIPVIRVVRLVRSARSARMLRRYGVENMQNELGADRAGSTLLTVAFLGILVLELGSYFILGAEGRDVHGQYPYPFGCLVVVDRYHCHGRLWRQVPGDKPGARHWGFCDHNRRGLVRCLYRLPGQYLHQSPETAAAFWVSTHHSAC